jgi:hypothetical protein
MTEQLDETSTLARLGLDDPALWARAAWDQTTALAIGLALSRHPELLAQLECARRVGAPGGGQSVSGVRSGPPAP